MSAAGEGLCGQHHLCVLAAAQEEAPASGQTDQRPPVAERALSPGREGWGPTAKQDDNIHQGGAAGEGQGATVRIHGPLSCSERLIEEE